MYFRGMVLVILIAAIFKVNAISNQLDALNSLVYQNPTKALIQLHTFELEAKKNPLPKKLQLRLALLKCETFLQQGKNLEAINLALKFEPIAEASITEATPYFMACRADAYASFANLSTALPLIDTAISQAKHFRQTQALANLLRLRGQLDTENGNYLSAIEDLRLALDVYDDIHTQTNNWLWPPKAYLYTAMGNLLYASGDLNQALAYGYKALEQPESIDKIRHILLLTMARMTLDNNEINKSDTFIQQAKSLLSAQSSAVQKAYSYGIMASIEIDKKNYSLAKSMLNSALTTLKNNNQQIPLMQMQRLMALVLFAEGQDKAAINLINQAITTGELYQQYSYLELFYDLLSQYYARKNQYNIAYDYLKLSFDAARKADNRISNIRFSQFKARLDQKNLKEISLFPQVAKSTSQEFQLIHWLIILLLSGMLVLGLLFILGKNSKKNHLDELITTNTNATTNYDQSIEISMQNAKKNGYPVNLLIIDTGKINPKHLEKIKMQIKRKLRKQDDIFHYSNSSVLILLPFTPPHGAKKVMRQLEISLQPWLAENKIKMGFASMKQFDTPKSLIKRAIANQVCHYKANELKLSELSAR